MLETAQPRENLDLDFAMGRILAIPLAMWR